ncbi:MAG TPA: PilT/PilU family type 4a pilus ATPase [Actinomycetota bacterium]
MEEDAQQVEGQGPEAAAPESIVDEFNTWLGHLVNSDGSDLHVKVGSPPMIRLRGILRRVEREPLTAGDTQALVAAIVPADRRRRLDEEGEVDFAHSLPGVGRFRVNAFRQRGSISIVLRKLRFGGPEFAEIGLPEVCRRLSDEHRGLILVTGPTGSGKTTTLSAMIEHINKTRPVHIVTIEDPIEVVFEDKVASINQREVGLDTQSFLGALRVALRQDPDVILIGEMRDPETVRTALQAAETGHLVLSTLHTLDATETVNRVVDFFPPHQQQQIRFTLAGSLRGILSQRLLPAIDGDRVPAVEVLVNTGRIQERIIDASMTAEIREVIQEGEYYGMQTFEQSLLQLVQDGQVAVEEAMVATTEPHDFRLMLEQAGITEVGALKTV